MITPGDRHLRPEPTGTLRELRPGPRIVVIRAEPAYAESFAGQVLLQLLTNLLARQFGVVQTILLDVPSVPVDPRAFPMPGTGDNLPDRLLAVGRAAAATQMDIDFFTTNQVPHATVLVGPDSQPATDDLFTLATYGAGWDAFCSPLERSPSGDAKALAPYGPMLAASLAAGMIFLFFRGITTTRTVGCNLWTFDRASWSASDNPVIGALQLPAAYLIGLGAVGAAFLVALVSTPGLQGTLVGVDPQSASETDINRLLTANVDQVGDLKAVLAAKLFDQSQIRFFPNATLWPDYITDPERVVPAALQEDEARFRYEWIISCVDRNIHRRNIARYLPRHVLAGATFGLVAQAAYYAFEGDSECLACNHPAVTFDMAATVAELKSLTKAERVERYGLMELEAAKQAAIEEYLADPTCGHVAEAELRRLGIGDQTDWSVGFVSAAAGIMLAAYFTRCGITNAREASTTGTERRLFFGRNPDLVISRAFRKKQCDICSDPDLLGRYDRRWSS